MVVVLISNQSKEATMFRASVGGRDAAHTVYRHALVRVMSPLLAPLAIGKGWSAFSLALAATLMRRGTAHRPLRQRLARAVLDEYHRARGKASYQWARKKQHAPPGAPTVTMATAEQVRAAQRVRVQSEAAQFTALGATPPRRGQLRWCHLDEDLREVKRRRRIPFIYPSVSSGALPMWGASEACGAGCPSSRRALKPRWHSSSPAPHAGSPSSPDVRSGRLVQRLLIRPSAVLSSGGTGPAATGWPPPR